MSDDKEIAQASKQEQKTDESAPVATPGTGDTVERPSADAPVEKASVDEEKEKVLAAKASREMWTAILIIVGSFVFVLVAAALVIVIGHIQLF